MLEYASPVWSPQYNYLVDKIESVQRRYTKRLPRYSVLDYHTRLKSLEQYSLEKRHIVHDLVLTYKIISGSLMYKRPNSLSYEMISFLLGATPTRSFKQVVWMWDVIFYWTCCRYFKQFAAIDSQF